MFTSKEFQILSNGLLVLISNAKTAMALCSSDESRKALASELDVVQELNKKVCDMWKSQRDDLTPAEQTTAFRLAMDSAISKDDDDFYNSSFRISFTDGTTGRTHSIELGTYPETWDLFTRIAEETAIVINDLDD